MHKCNKEYMKEFMKNANLCESENQKPNKIIGTFFHRCLSTSCQLNAHVRCLAKHMLQREPPGTLLPLEGPCPSCGSILLWGDLVRLKRGCYQQEEEEVEDHWVETLSQAI